MSTCLVAGSTGLVGSFLVKKLADNGNKVFALTEKKNSRILIIKTQSRF
ncbi:MAG: hypothetical protein Ct9H90mP4_06520 [Gammaproteobacteria bacterium]|nr:MAG: hypothetical protein Ct9H90mP4_06520 [Gammaproteobacteria bacterium]